MAIITCEDLVVGYDGAGILEPLNFRIESGDYLCIIGENGSGKTTLMKTLLHLTPPISGRIIMDEGLRHGEIGYLPQQTLVQRDFPASVQEIVLSGCLNRIGRHPFFHRGERELAMQMMRKMRIAGLKDRCYRELSGGQQQRVLLARALCATRKVLLLDEPVAGLDPTVTEEMYQIIEGLNKNDGITIIMISHDLASVEGYATHVLSIGKNIFFGTKEEYRQQRQERTVMPSEPSSEEETEEEAEEETDEKEA